MMLMAAAVGLGFETCRLSADTNTPLVAAAASLRDAMQALVDEFRQSGGGRLNLAFGASGNLYRQLRQGAPFQALFSADESYIDRLAADGVIEDSGQIYALGRPLWMTGASNASPSPTRCTRPTGSGRVKRSKTSGSGTALSPDWWWGRTWLKPRSSP